MTTKPKIASPLGADAQAVVAALDRLASAIGRLTAALSEPLTRQTVAPPLRWPRKGPTDTRHPAGDRAG
jgi:hypothetical protein